MGTLAFCQKVLFFAGISAGEELVVEDVLRGVPEDSLQTALADAAWQSVCHEYDRIENAIRDPSRREGMRQPWLE